MYFLFLPLFFFLLSYCVSCKQPRVEFHFKSNLRPILCKRLQSRCGSHGSYNTKKHSTAYYQDKTSGHSFILGSTSRRGTKRTVRNQNQVTMPFAISHASLRPFAIFQGFASYLAQLMVMATSTFPTTWTPNSLSYVSDHALHSSASKLLL